MKRKEVQMYKSFLIKYAEIGVKGKNRYIFENALVDNIRYQLQNIEGEFTVRKESGRIYAAICASPAVVFAV